MRGPLVALSAGAYEGAFVDCGNPRTQALGGAGALRAGVGSLLPAPGGVIVGRFAWADGKTGLVYSAYADALDAPNLPMLGFAIPNSMPDVNNSWQRTYTTVLADGITRARVLRPGLEVTLCNRGDFWARFADGAFPGQPVYANLLDGSAIAGNTVGAVLTPWSVLTAADPGGLAAISTWSNFT